MKSVITAIVESHMASDCIIRHVEGTSQLESLANVAGLSKERYYNEFM